MIAPEGSPARTAEIDQLVAPIAEMLDGLIAAFLELRAQHGEAQATADLARLVKEAPPANAAALAAVAIARLADAAS